MIAFEVSINGTKRCVAGPGDLGLVSAIVNWIIRDENTHERDVSVTGLRQPAGEFVEWFRDEIAVGDEITIKIIETDHIDDAEVRRVGPPSDGC